MLSAASSRLFGAWCSHEHSCKPENDLINPAGRFAHIIQQREQSLADHDSRNQDRPQKSQSSWDAIEAGGGRGGGADYLYELGQSDYNTNVDAGQNISMIDSLFTGEQCILHSSRHAYTRLQAVRQCS